MPGQGLARTARLRKAAEFDRVFAERKKLVSDCFMLSWGDSGCSPRLGLAISRKQAPLAVQRNRLKRIVREAFRALLPQLPCMGMIFMARSSAVRVSRAELRKDADKLLRQVISSMQDKLASREAGLPVDHHSARPTTEGS